MAGDGTGYLDIAGFIKGYGAKPRKDLLELWQRIVFNMAVSNTDDHLRNHALLLSANGWTLSPLYDVNPVPYGDELSLLVDDAYNSISLDLAIRTAPRFNVSVQAAGRIVGEMTAVIRENWERLAKEYGLSHSQIEYMRPAFGECYRE